MSVYIYLCALLVIIVVVIFYIKPLNKRVAMALMQDGTLMPYEHLKKTYPLGRSSPIHIFFHICTQGTHWKQILQTQMNSIIKCGLYDKCEVLWYGCSCDRCVPLLQEFFAPYKKVKPLERAMCDKQKTYENSTLNSMIRLCQSLPYDVDCLYIHTKGTTAKSKAQHAWREYMMYWLVKHHHVAVDILRRGFYTVGTLYQKLPVDVLGYHRLYSGNFFWVRSEYMKMLPIVKDMSNRFKAEQLIFGKYSRGKHACINPETYLSVYIPVYTGLYKDAIEIESVPVEKLNILIT